MLNILITGAKGFAGSNLVANLKNIRDGKDRTHPSVEIGQIFEYDMHSTKEELEYYCEHADYVFHFAGVNRTDNANDFHTGNVSLTRDLLQMLKDKHSKATFMLASSIQASLAGRFQNSVYGISKREAEALVFQYGQETGNHTLVYRFPNLAGKWIRPEYNSAIGTFCHHIANDIPIHITNRATILEVLFIDDMIQELIGNMEGVEHRCSYPPVLAFPSTNEQEMSPVVSAVGQYCYVPNTYTVTLGDIADMLNEFHDQPETMLIPEIPNNSFRKKLYSMYLSYLPENKVVVDLNMHKDDRGSFTELIKTKYTGQVSVNISKPGITKGNHWHNTKWEFFIVVSGRALIQQQRIGTDENGKPYPVLEFEVSGDRMQAVHMLPGYTHNITNLSDTQDLVTVMWANELFDPEHPDTFAEPIQYSS